MSLFGGLRKALSQLNPKKRGQEEPQEFALPSEATNSTEGDRSVLPDSHSVEPGQPFAETAIGFNESQFVRELSLVRQMPSGIKLYKHSCGIHVIAKDLATIDLGGKADGIIALASQNLPIPKSLFVSVDIFEGRIEPEANMNAVRPNIDKLYKNVLDDVLSCMSSIGFKGAIVIRSSGPEDRIEHSASGVFYSCIDILNKSNTDSVRQSIVAVISSPYANGGRFFKAMNLPLAPIPFIVQDLVHNTDTWGEGLYAPLLSGIANLSRDGAMTLVFSPGLGDTVAHGESSNLIFYDTDSDVITREGKSDAFRLYVERQKREDQDRILERAKERSFGKAHLSDDIIRKIQSEASRNIPFDRDLDIEFSVRDTEDLKRGKVTYLQRRTLPALQENLPLPVVSQEHQLAFTKAVSGQGMFSTCDLLVVDFTNEDARSNFLEPSKALIRSIKTFDQHHPEGYLVLLKTGSSVDLVGAAGEYTEDDSKSFASQFSMVVKNTKGMIFREYRNTDAHKGLIVSHFSGFLRSQRIPAIVINNDHVRTDFDDQTELNQVEIFPGILKCTLSTPWLLVANQSNRAGSYGFLANVPTPAISLEQET